MTSSIQPGDLLAFYVSGRKQFAAVCRVTSPVVEKHTRIWQSRKKPDELYPYRAGIAPPVVLPEERGLDAEPYRDRFGWTERWHRTSWPLAYRGGRHETSQEDVDLPADFRRGASEPARGS